MERFRKNFESGRHACRRKLMHKNRIIGLICPFLPLLESPKSQSIRKMIGRGGGDRTHKPCHVYHVLSRFSVFRVLGIYTKLAELVEITGN